MREITNLSELQTILKDILSVFADYCDKHNLFYSLYGGTMLGAIRHQDIIPWDDDVDVCMPRPDYDKLISLQETDPIPGCMLFAPGMRDYIYPFLKVSMNGTRVRETYLESRYSVFGIYIDVFPMDGYPLNFSDTQFLQICDKLDNFKSSKTMACMNCRRENRFKEVLLYIKKCLITNGHKFDYYLKKIVSIAEDTEFKYDDAEYLVCLYSAYIKKLKIKKSDYMERRLYQLGNREYYGIKNYDIYLFQLYGDYMKLPPVEKRQSIHYAKFYVNEGTV